MKELLKDKRATFILTGSVALIIFIYYSLVIAHHIDKRMVSNTPGTTLNLISDDVEYQAYDVDGMTEEEIKEYLDIIRSGADGADE